MGIRSITSAGSASDREQNWVENVSSAGASPGLYPSPEFERLLLSLDFVRHGLGRWSGFLLLT